jgi:hypothetical protein
MFQDELARFEGQAGYRIEIKLTSQGVTRARSTAATRLTVDEGRRSVCRRYNVYTLRGGGFTLKLSDVAVLEETDWDKRTRTVTFFTPKLEALQVDGAAAEAGRPLSATFKAAGLRAGSGEFNSSSPGTLRIGPTTVEIDLTATSVPNR